MAKLLQPGGQVRERLLQLDGTRLGLVELADDAPQLSENGWETLALKRASLGAQLAEPLEEPLALLARRRDVVDELAADQLIARLRGAPLDVLPFTALSSVGDGYAELRNTMSGAITRIAADAVIAVGERRARDWRSLVPPGPTVRVIGDALVPRRVAHAISEGRAAAEAIRDSRARSHVATARA